jgi:putative ABC transport system permease protein
VIPLARWLLRMLLPRDARDAVIAELDDEHDKKRRGAAGAPSAWYWRQVIGSLPAAIGMRLRRATRLAGDAAADARFAIRFLLRAKGFSLAAVLTLALGIGTATAMFGVADAVILRPLPYAAPARLVRIWSANPRGIARNQISAADFFDWREHVRGLDSLAGFSVLDVTLTTGGDPERMPAATSTANLAGTLGVSPLVGRWFTDAEVAGSAQPVAVITEALWRQRFGADRSLIGRAISVDGVSRTVIGIMPATFQIPGSRERLYLPLPDGWRAFPRSARYLGAIGRMAPGIEIDAVRQSLQGVAARLASTHPDADRGWGITIVSLTDAVLGDVRRPLIILIAAMASVLAIACANVTSLLLARGVARGPELAVRAAVGATRGRLARMQFVEIAMLAIGGGALAIVLAAWCIQLVPAIRGLGLPLLERVALDWRVLGAAATLTFLCALVTGLWPAWTGSRRYGAGTLGSGHRSTATDVKARQTIVAAQIAVSTALVAIALLLIVSLQRLTAVPTGFVADTTLLADMALPSTRYGRDTLAPFYLQFLERVRAVPGVRVAAAGGPLPLSGLDGLLRFGVSVDGGAAADRNQRAYIRWATPGYFEAMGIRLAAGRDFAASDGPRAAPVAVIDAEFARRYFPGIDPLGHRVRTPLNSNAAREIIGVVEAVRQSTLDRAAEPHVYVAETQYPSPELTLVVRGDRQPEAIAPDLRAVLRELDPELPLSNIRPLRSLVEDAAAPRRVSAQLLVSFAAAALLLTLVGVYGVMSQIVAQSTRELGIRVALGASEPRIVGLTVRRAARMALLGVMLGTGIAWLAAPMLAGLLYGIAPRDPRLIGGAALLMTTIALLAAYLPARRLLRFDVVHALRTED